MEEKYDWLAVMIDGSGHIQMIPKATAEEALAMVNPNHFDFVTLYALHPENIEHKYESALATESVWKSV